MAFLFTATAGTGASATSVYATSHTPSDLWYVHAYGGFTGKMLAVQISTDGTNWTSIVTDLQDGAGFYWPMHDQLMRGYVGAAGAGSVTLETWIAGTGQVMVQ